MKISVAKTSGWCMGVRKAVNIALDSTHKYKGPIYSYGPLIHNSNVLELLNEKGVEIITDIPESGSGTVIIRAHGVPPEAKKKLELCGFNVIDATCPRVVKVQAIIRKYADRGYSTIIIGDNEHPEVIGLLGYTKGNGHVVDMLEKIESLPEFEKAIIVAQTTQNTHFFGEIEKWASEKFHHYKIFNTICDSTEKRQNEVKKLAESVDAIIVIGGHDSGNTKRLADLAAQSGIPSYHVENESELDPKVFELYQKIGITAGASTPNWVLKKVLRFLENLSLKNERSWRKTLYPVAQFFFLTNIYISLGAGSLSYACSMLQGIENYSIYILMSILYVISMHSFNNLTGGRADHYNDPTRAHFYSTYRIPLACFAAVASLAGLACAYTIEMSAFIILLIMSVSGVLYNFSIIPEKFGEILGKNKLRRIRDIGGSKTILIALAWGIVITIFPAAYETSYFGLDNFIVFIWATGLVFVRTAFFDIMDMQGDRIVGKETIPILLGEETTSAILKFMLVFLFLLLFFASLFSIVTSFGYIISLISIILFPVMRLQRRSRFLPGFWSEFVIDTKFILTGLLALIWSLL